MSESPPTDVSSAAPSADAQYHDELYRVVSELADEFAYADRVELDGTIVPEWVTPAFTRVTGYTRDELMRRPEGFVLVHSEDLPAFEQHVERVLKGEANETEVRIVTKNGMVRWIHSRVAPVWDQAHERVIRVHGTARDVTRQRRAEDDARLNTSVFDGLPFGVYVWRLEDPADLRSFRLVSANLATSRISGVAAESVIGRTIEEAFPALLGSDLPGQYRSVIRSGEPLDLGEVRYGDERVAERVFAMRAFPLPGSCVGVAFTDLSDLHRTRDALHQTEEAFARLLRAESAAILVLAADGDRILDVNDRGIAAFGRERSEMLDRSPVDLGLWAYRPDGVTALRQVRASGKSMTGHGTFRRKSGETFLGMFSLEPIDYHNSPAVIFMLMEAPERRGRTRGA